MKLFLDDMRVPYDVFKMNLDFSYHKNEDWVIVKSYSDFTEFISNNDLPKIISFDHDLSFDHYLSENQKNINYNTMSVKTGYHALEWLIVYCKLNKKPLPEIKLHTQNIEGMKNMKKLLF